MSSKYPLEVLKKEKRKKKQRRIITVLDPKKLLHNEYIMFYKRYSRGGGGGAQYNTWENSNEKRQFGFVSRLTSIFLERVLLDLSSSGKIEGLTYFSEC